jgi:hypothetical protein
MTNESTCMSPSCGITIDGIVTRCPECGGLMRSSRTIRALGWAALICCLMALSLIGSMLWMFSRSGTFTGTRVQALLSIGGFSFVVLFVLIGVADSVYRIVTGRPNRGLVKMLLRLLGIFFIGMLVLSIIGNGMNLLSAHW